MIAPWAVYAVALGSLIALAAALTDRLATIWLTPRRLTWLVGLFLALGLPVILAIRIGSDPRPQETIAAVDSTPFHPPIASTTDRSSSRATVSGHVRRPRSAGVREAMAALEPHLIALWLVSSTIVLVTLCVGAIGLANQMRRWRETSIDGVHVLISPATGPAVVGVLRPRVVFPEWALALDASARRLMLLHEIEHIRARDPYVLFLATLSVLLAPWNVALWFIARRLRLAVEMDCDRRVVKASGDVREYGLLLLDVGARRTTNLPIGAALVERRSFLARRITTMIANKPRHSVLDSLLLVTCVAFVSIAAARIPHPQALVRLRHVSLDVHQRRATSSGSHRGTTQAVAATIRAAVPSAGGIVASRKSTRGTLPRITVDWQNAPIHDVVAALAKFSGRKIGISKGVSGVVTAHIVDRPWDEALAWIVGVHGFRLVMQPDSSIVISSMATPRPEAATRVGRLALGTAAQNDVSILTRTTLAPTNRTIVGRVLDDSTGLPVAGTEIRVIGLQAIGEPNRACTGEDGEFHLKGPDGEVWLDAFALDYQFSRVTLAPRDSIAIFRGRRTMSASAARVARAGIESIEVVKGAAATAIYGPAAANGVIVIATREPRAQNANGALWFRSVAVGRQIAPLLVVDGVVVGPDTKYLLTPCQQH